MTAFWLSLSFTLLYSSGDLDICVRIALVSLTWERAYIMRRVVECSFAYRPGVTLCSCWTLKSNYWRLTNRMFRCWLTNRLKCSGRGWCWSRCRMHALVLSVTDMQADWREIVDAFPEFSQPVTMAFLTGCLTETFWPLNSDNTQWTLHSHRLLGHLDQISRSQ